MRDFLGHGNLDHSVRNLFRSIHVLFQKQRRQGEYVPDIVEPVSVKEQIVKSATEVASMILRIDDVIASSKSAGGPPGGGMPPGGMGGGMGGMY